MNSTAYELNGVALQAAPSLADVNGVQGQKLSMDVILVKRIASSSTAGRYCAEPGVVVLDKIRNIRVLPNGLSFTFQGKYHTGYEQEREGEPISGLDGRHFTVHVARHCKDAEHGCAQGFMIEAM